MLQWYLLPYQKYADFSGRSRRKEYWIFTLVNALLTSILEAFANATDLFTIIYVLFALFLIIPSIAVAVRRLHDTGRSGWWYLIILVPIIGWIILLVFLLLDSNDETNEYGANPKYQG